MTGTEHFWLGSLAVGMRDASGQMYMRNRYYDPQTGQFTQPDPIGLAGGMNVYGFAAGDPVTYTDPYGLSPKDIILQVIWTGPKVYHTSIRITPDDQEKWMADPRFSRNAVQGADGRYSLTLGAGPASVAKAVLGIPTRMVSNFNRAGDTAEQDETMQLSPGSQGEDAAINKLLTQDANYGDNLIYELYPDAGDGRYNSNGYVTGMLKAAGFAMIPCVNYSTPGSEKPVPAKQFAPE
jgi:RHS repeat-associated protein